MFARNRSFTLKYPVQQMGRAHEGRSAADCRARSRSARDQQQNLAGRKSRRSARPYPADIYLPLWLPFRRAHELRRPFSTVPESLTSFTVHLRAHPCSHTCIPFHRHLLTGQHFWIQHIDCLRPRHGCQKGKLFQIWADCVRSVRLRRDDTWVVRFDKWGRSGELC